MTTTPDVFLSFTRKGPPGLADAVHDTLARAGITPFRDNAVPVGDDISPTIVEALAGSRLMVVVYSAAYADRWACQWELIQAYLAGAADGDPTSRLLVVNPEPGNGHIVPAAVAGMMYLRGDQLDRLPGAVRAKLDRLPRPMSAAVRRTTPTWLPPSLPGSQGFVGRFRDLWRLHDALTAADRPLTQRTLSDPAAVVTGMGGIGKTSLVRAYAWLFDPAHPGGVYWTGVGGPGGIGAARERFDVQVRDLATGLGLPTEGEPADRVRVMLARYLDEREPCLWVVDDLPRDATKDDLAAFVVPSRRLRLLVTTRRAGTGRDLTRVALEGLHDADAVRLLGEFREIGETDRDAATAVARRLGGHPLALRAAGARLADMQGRMTYRQYADELAGGVDANILAVIEQSIADLGARPRLLITAAGLLAAAPVPAGVLARIEATSAAGLPAAPDDALRELSRHGAASRIGDTWQFHPLAVEAAARLSAAAVPIARLAAEAARALLDAVTAGGPAALLVRHVEALAGRAELDPGLAAALWRRAAEHHEHVGDLARAAAARYAVAAAPEASAADRVAYALAGVAHGEYARAAEQARVAVDAGAGGDLGVRARWALAAALDGLGRFPDAEDLWNGLDHAAWTPDDAERIAFDVARARARLARGRLGAALDVLRPLADLPLEAHADQINAARIEMARLLLLTGSERSGRALAEEVVRWYRDRDAAGHGRCVEAELVWAEAAVALELFELRPDTGKWKEAEATLERLHRDHHGAAGATESVTGLAVAVQRGLVLVRLGKQRQCREVLHPALAEIRASLGERHPLYLRARYALGLAHLQLNEQAAAAEVLRDTWQAQQHVLGPGHPETLATQLEYGIALKFLDESRRSAELIDDVCRRLPQEIGRRNDLYGRAKFAQRLLPCVPSWMLRGFQDLERRRKRFTGED